MFVPWCQLRRSDWLLAYGPVDEYGGVTPAGPIQLDLLELGFCLLYIFSEPGP